MKLGGCKLFYQLLWTHHPTQLLRYTPLKGWIKVLMRVLSFFGTYTPNKHSPESNRDIMLAVEAPNHLIEMGCIFHDPNTQEYFEYNSQLNTQNLKTLRLKYSTHKTLSTKPPQKKFEKAMKIYSDKGQNVFYKNKLIRIS